MPVAIEIRSWWEVPCVAHFCKIFSKPFKLPDYEIEVRAIYEIQEVIGREGRLDGGE